jgi:hypothetical protein
VYEVAIVFSNGSKVEFHATEFDINLEPQNLAGYSGGGNYSQVQKLTYKDADGNDAPLYLKPSEVAGIAVAISNDTGGRKYGLEIG